MRRDVHSEEIDRLQKLVGLHQTMRDANVNFQDVDSLSDEIEARRRRVGTLEFETFSEVRIAPATMGETQAEMNGRMHEEYEKAKLLLDAAAFQFRDMLSASAAQSFDESQRAWEVFVDRQAAASASYVQGGTLYPLAYSAELHGLTVAQTAYLREQIEHLEKL